MDSHQPNYAVLTAHETNGSPSENNVNEAQNATTHVQASLFDSSTRFQFLFDDPLILQEIVLAEKIRDVNDQDSLTVPDGQSVQAVSLQRFHSLYLSGRIHLRLNSGFRQTVLVVESAHLHQFQSSTIDAKDVLLDGAPVVLLDLLCWLSACDYVNKYAFLAYNAEFQCWELVGCLTPLVKNHPSQPDAVLDSNSKDDPSKPTNNKDVSDCFLPVDSDPENLKTPHGTCSNFTPSSALMEAHDPFGLTSSDPQGIIADPTRFPPSNGILTESGTQISIGNVCEDNGSLHGVNAAMLGDELIKWARNNPAALKRAMDNPMDLDMLELEEIAGELISGSNEESGLSERVVDHLLAPSDAASGIVTNRKDLCAT